MQIYENISLIFVFSQFSGFNHDFIIHFAFTRITASNGAIHDVTN